MYEEILEVVEQYFGSIGREDCECCAEAIVIKLTDPDGYKEIFGDEDEDETLSHKAQLAKHSQPDPLDTWYGEED